MEQATTEGIPSEGTCTLLRRAAAAGEAAERAVQRFGSAAMRGIAAFDAEVDPLHLPAAAYERVVRSSGLRRIVDTAERIESAALAVQTERAA